MSFLRSFKFGKPLGNFSIGLCDRSSSSSSFSWMMLVPASANRHSRRPSIFRRFKFEKRSGSLLIGFCDKSKSFREVIRVRPGAISVSPQFIKCSFSRCFSCTMDCSGFCISLLPDTSSVFSEVNCDRFATFSNLQLFRRSSFKFVNLHKLSWTSVMGL